jgi:ribonuclease R
VNAESSNPAATSDEIVAFLARSRRPARPQEIARGLGISGRGSYARFKRALEDLERSGRVVRQRKGRYALLDDLNLVRGILQVTRSGDAFLLPDTDGPDVYIPGRERKSAVEGDRVLVRIEHRPPGRNPVGRVIRILERASDQVVGVYRRKKGYGFVAAQEPRLDIELFIPPGAEAEAEDGQVVVVAIESWGESGPGPVGRVERVLGAQGDPAVTVLAILHGHRLPVDFPTKVEREAQDLSAAGIGQADLEGRDDYREHLVFTIDPADAKDHDDGLSLRRLDNGKLELGVHIADVSHYVRRGSSLDEEAAERGTSVYLVDRVIPMLPHALSSDLCSLVPDEDRLAFSVLFRIDETGQVEEARLARTVIRSRFKLAYEDAQDILDGDRPAPEEVSAALAELERLSRIFRKRRTERGSIDFDLPESRVVLNACGEPTDIQRVLRLRTHMLIEDFMILANEAVAQLAERQKIPMIYRVHEAPPDRKLEGLRTLAATFGFRLPAKNLEPSDLAKLVRAMEGTPQEQLVSTVTLRSMSQARYDAENLGHFGLASEAYAHFTSPIRRYPDLVVHRQLKLWLDEPARARKESHEYLEAVAATSSQRERSAVEAERDSVDAMKVEFMQRHLGDDFVGSISGVAAFGIFVLLDDFHVDGLVHVSSLTDDYYRFEESRHALIGRRRKRTYRLGDPVRVQVVRVDRENRRIDFELVEKE